MAMSLDPIMDKIINAGLRYLKNQVKWQTGMKKDLLKLQQNLPHIQAVVHFASSQGQIADQNPALNEWLWQLRDAIDDADDVFDELEYMELKKQVTKNKKVRRVRSIMKSMKKRLVKIVKRVHKIDPNLNRLEAAVNKLDKVSTTGVDTFLHLVQHAKQEQKEQLRDLYVSRETGSLPKNDLIGRRKEKELVMKWLRNPSNEHRGNDFYKNIYLLSIVGHGGMGKTTLLQHLYKDEQITKEFHLKMWVCVSNNFDVKKVIADMFESLKKERPRLETLEALQGCLEEEVMSKKFLLVLDDIWDEEERDQSKWEDVLAPLASGGFGSKILVTTRMDSVALRFAKVIKKEEEIVKLESLEEDECLELLISHAFAGVKNPPDDHKKLRDIAGEIVKKLLGSPLAAKVIGGVLKDKLDERHWRSVLESNLLGQNSIDSILSLSYILLSNPLKSCFKICCMFAQDHKYRKNDLIRMWIALGFIQPSQGMTMEDIGERYFDVLVKKTLLEKVGDDHKMHDLIHESASKFFEQECGKLMDDEQSSLKISETVRHLSVQTINPSIIKKIGQLKYLHSIFLFHKASNQDICSALGEIFKASKSLRLLYMDPSTRLNKIPDEIGNLIHLRYLNIEGLLGTRLPRSLSILYHLQYISIRLSHYELGCCSEWETLPPFGQLPLLKSLSLTNMPKVKWLESKFNGNEQYHAFPSLEELRISKLEALEGWFEAGVAAEEDGCFFPSLILLSLFKCPKLKELPSLPPKLKTLIIYKIGWMTLNFCSNSNPIPLEKLQVFECPNITSLPLADEIARLAALRYLTITECPNLISLGRYQEAENTNNCHLILDYLVISDPSVLLMEPLRSIASLKRLTIEFNDEVVSFPNEAEQWFLNVSSSLCELQFFFLQSLQSLPSSLESLSSLQKLYIEDVPMLRELPNLPPSLEGLEISDLKSLESLPSSLESLSSLQKLRIKYVPMLRELPNLPPSLQRLSIRDCDPELKERYGEDGGSDRHKIAHIPDIDIEDW